MIMNINNKLSCMAFKAEEQSLGWTSSQTGFELLMSLLEKAMAWIAENGIDAKSVSHDITKYSSAGIVVLQATVVVFYKEQL